jgi:hypothetical protein
MFIERWKGYWIIFRIIPRFLNVPPDSKEVLEAISAHDRSRDGPEKSCICDAPLFIFILFSFYAKCQKREE